MKNPRYLKVSVPVRYWDDATINGVQDEQGSNVPFKNGDLWEPVIDIKNDSVMDWPTGVEADFHFKVCDSGSYFLLNEKKEVIASKFEDYVPDGLCHGDRGYGDYIIFSVNGDGSIKDFSESIDLAEWEDNER